MMNDGNSSVIFVTIAPVVVEIADKEWQEELGSAMQLPGGTQVVFSEDMKSRMEGIWSRKRAQTLEEKRQRIELTVNDKYLPAVRATISLEQAMSVFSMMKAKHGPRKSLELSRCIHADENPVPGCQYCFYKQWKASKKNIEQKLKKEVGDGETGEAAAEAKAGE